MAAQRRGHIQPSVTLGDRACQGGCRSRIRLITMCCPADAAELNGLGLLRRQPVIDMEDWYGARASLPTMDPRYGGPAAPDRRQPR